MSSLDRLNEGTLSTASQLAFYDPANGADRRASVADLIALVQSSLTESGDLVTQYSSPNATGFSVTVAPPTAGANVHLLITPLAGYAAGTVVLPASPVDGQQVVVTSTQAITTLTVSGNGASVNGAPATLAANGYFRLRYDQINNSFYRIG